MVTTNQPDPCLTFVTGWNAALKECEAIAQVSKTDEAPNAYWATHVAGFFDRLNSGDVPSATTAEGAAAALRRALEWDDIEDQDATMIRAALAFLDASAPTPPADPLAMLIAEFREQEAALDQMSDEEFSHAVAEGDPVALERLRDNPPAATNMAGVEAALQLVADEQAKGNDWLDGDFIERTVMPFFRARPAYLEGGSV